jgi:hypothetical protein
MVDDFRRSVAARSLLASAGATAITVAPAFAAELRQERRSTASRADDHDGLAGERCEGLSDVERCADRVAVRSSPSKWRRSNNGQAACRNSSPSAATFARGRTRQLIDVFAQPAPQATRPR